MDNGEIESQEVEVLDESATEEGGTEENGESDPLEVALAEIAELRDQLLRTHAEMENVRKRAKREATDAGKYAIERFARSLLDISDNMERALDVNEGNEKTLREGIEMTISSWHEALKRSGIERIDAVGETFDPHRHEAMLQSPSDEEDGVVIAQHVAGYMLHDRLLRPAKVIVSSGPAESKNDEG